MKLTTQLFTLAALVAAPMVAQAQNWGSVTGRFVYDGDIPKPLLVHKKGAAIRDGETCAAEDFVNQNLVIDAKTKGIANIFVYAYRPKKVNKDLLAELKKESSSVVFDQKGCRFTPRCLVVRTDQTVKVLSDDPIAHNTHTFPIKNQGENILIPPNEREGIPLKTLPLAESLPFEVKCDLHSWMKAYFLVVDHPYASVTQKDGTFTIKGLPAGTNEFRVWHERVGYIDRKFKVKVTAGEVTNIGDVKVAAAEFED